jgi:hypothetical protein
MIGELSIVFPREQVLVLERIGHDEAWLGTALVLSSSLAAYYRLSACIANKEGWKVGLPPREMLEAGHWYTRLVDKGGGGGGVVEKRGDRELKMMSASDDERWG